MQAWINYKSIQDSITQEKKQIIELQEEIDYMQRWYQEYLKSEYASYFLWHENGQLYAGERLVYLEYWKPDIETKEDTIMLVPTEEELQEEVNELVVSPEEAWMIFLQQKFPDVWEFFLAK